MPLQSDVSRVLHAIQSPLSADTLGGFLKGLRRGYEELHAVLLGQSGQAGHAALTQAFDQLRTRPRQRRMLELCAWPIFDKPQAPEIEGEGSAFLWLFCVPLLVQLPDDKQDLLSLPSDFLDTTACIELIEASKCMNPRAIVSGFSSLFTREDLHSYGPGGVAEIFVGAEKGVLDGVPQPLPIVRDPDIESSRCVQLNLWLCARLPEDEKQLFVDLERWPKLAIDSMLKDAFSKHGIPIEELESLPGSSMATSLLRCMGPGFLEMERWVDLGIQHYGLNALYLAVPVEGMAEIIGVTPGGEELMLAPTFAFVEPTQELSATLERIATARGLYFRGAHASAVQTSSALH